MIVKYGTTPDELTFSIDKLFKNIPISLGSTLKTTQPYDYNQDILHTQYDENVIQFNCDELIKNISFLYEQFLFEINNEISLLYLSSSLTFDDFIVSKSLSYNKYISSDILKISVDWGIKDYLFIAIDLVKKHFPTFQDISISLEKDQEIDEEWIVLDVTIEGEIEEVLDKYDKYTENFVYEIPWPERERIRFSYNII